MPKSSESTALNNTVRGEPISPNLPVGWPGGIKCLGRETPFNRGQVEQQTEDREQERRRKKKKKHSQAELKPLEINNWRHSFCVWARQRWLLKCHLGRDIEMKETPLCISIIEGVCDCLSGGEGRRRARAILPHLGWIARQELGRHSIRKRCWGVWGVRMLHCFEHVQNLSRISLHYDPMQDRGRIGCMLRSSLQWHTYSHSLCMLVPGELELTLYAGLPTFQMKKRGIGPGCLNTVFDVITLSLAKLNHISFYWSHSAAFYATCVHQHQATLNCKHGASVGLSDEIQELDWTTSIRKLQSWYSGATNDILLCSLNVGHQQLK